jgi:hypothetical protein
MEKQQLSQPDCVALATRTAEILAGLEERQLVHADISSSNVFIDAVGQRPRIELIDVEDMFHPNFIDVPDPPDGTPGYRHPRNEGQGCRNPHGDRFAASILLAEMLTWHQSAIRTMADEESVFRQNELCRDTRKFTVMRDALTAHSKAAADLFEQAWRSYGLSGCPTLAQWRSALHAAQPARATITPTDWPLVTFPAARAARPIRQLRSQTSFLSRSLCTECNRFINPSTPTDHAQTCSHHPLQFTPEFDPSTWLTGRSKPSASPDFRELLVKYSNLSTCDSCGKLVTGPGDDAHAPLCRYRLRGGRPTVPHHDDISFVPISATAPSPPSTTAATSWPRASLSGPGTCSECGRAITFTGTNELGHKLMCSKSRLRTWLRDL